MKHETLLSLPLSFIHLRLIDMCSVSWIILPESQTKFLPPSQNYTTIPVWCFADCRIKDSPHRVATHMLCRSVTSLTREAWAQCVNLIDNSTKQSLSHFVWGGKSREKKWAAFKYFMRGNMPRCHYNSCKTFPSSSFTLKAVNTPERGAEQQ